MDEPRVSRLVPYSLGVIVENKDLSSVMVEVSPIEDQHIQSGEILKNITTYKAEAQNSDGAAYQTDIKMGPSVTAEWLPLGTSNRQTPPDVRRGEYVVIYRFGDTDKYWWNTLFNDLRHRRLETIVFCISATKNEKAIPGDDNSYVFEMSSHKGIIAVHTSAANDEPFKYDIVLNTKEGNFKIVDDIGNELLIDSAESRIYMTNDKGSFIDMNKLILTMSTGERIDLKTKAYSLTAEDSITEKTNAHQLNATAESTVTTARATLAAPDIELDGTITQGKGGNAGTAIFGSSIEAIGSIESRKSVDAPIVHGVVVKSDQPIQAPNVK